MCDHIMILCPGCRGIVSQCRCVEPDKPVTIAKEKCKSCKEQEKEKK